MPGALTPGALDVQEACMRNGVHCSSSCIFVLVRQISCISGRGQSHEEQRKLELSMNVFKHRSSARYVLIGGIWEGVLCVPHRTKSLNCDDTDI